jgi:metal-responsive CopG/Arc/MetJ family transcriptional regulator
MKSHISATIDESILEQTDRYGSEERRSRSQVIEMALDAFLRERTAPSEDVVTSRGRFDGKFSREETYAR